MMILLFLVRSDFPLHRSTYQLRRPIMIKQDSRLIMNRVRGPTFLSAHISRQSKETDRKLPTICMNGSIRLICLSARVRLANQVSRA